MPLTKCAECGHQISTQADACPGCGHPNAVDPQLETGTKCYYCSDSATTKCQRCDAYSCAKHLKSIAVYYERGRYHGRSYELRCKFCHSHAEVSNQESETWSTVIIISSILLMILGAVWIGILTILK